MSPVCDSNGMETWFRTTQEFDKWRDGLGETTRARVDLRLERAYMMGHFGDHHGVGGEVSEMRLDFGPGYRLYYTAWEYRGQVLLLLLGGDKSTQRRDIKKAKALLADAKADAEREIDKELKKREEEQRGR